MDEQDLLNMLLADDVTQGYDDFDDDGPEALSGEQIQALMGYYNVGENLEDVMGRFNFKKFGKKLLMPHKFLPKKYQKFVAPHTMVTNALRNQGRQRQAQNTASNFARMALAQKSIPVTPYNPTKGRYWPLGFDSVNTIAAGATAIIESSPQVEFRPERLVVPTSISGNFLISDLKVGKNSQFISNDPIPAESFEPDAADVVLRMDSAKISQVIALTVENISGAPSRFYASLMGPAIE